VAQPLPLPLPLPLLLLLLLLLLHLTGLWVLMDQCPSRMRSPGMMLLLPRLWQQQ